MANLGTIRSQVRNLVLERSGDTGLITDSEANEIINMASRILFNRICEAYPEPFALRSPINTTVTAGSSTPFTSISSSASRILSVSVGSVGAAATALKPIPPLRKPKDSIVYANPTVLPALPSRWYTEGPRIYFAPLTSGSFDIRAVYVGPPADMASDADPVWYFGSISVLPELHDAIAVLASLMILAKDSANTAPFKDVFAYVDKIMNDRFGGASQYDPVRQDKP